MVRWSKPAKLDLQQIHEVFPDKVEVLALIHSKRNFIKDFLNEQRHEER